jgi:arylsulfatase
MVIVHPGSEGGREANALASSLDLVPTLLGFAGIGAAARASRYPFLKGEDLGAVVASPRVAGPRDTRGNLLVFSAVHASNPQSYRLRVALQRSRSRVPRFPEDFIEWSTRSFYRGVTDGRYRFARYFSPNNHHSPDSWQALLAGNDLELYDDREDPQNLTNLAAEPLRYHELIETLNRKLLLLLKHETSAPDDGRHMPGAPSLWSGHG